MEEGLSCCIGCGQQIAEEELDGHLANCIGATNDPE
jgi:hypothetical protein